MKLFASLLLLLVACGSDGLEPGRTDSSTSGTSRPASSMARVRDTGGGIDTIETSQRRIDGPPRASAAAGAGADTRKKMAASGEGKGSSSASSSKSAASKPPSEPPKEVSSARRSPDAEDAGPPLWDASAAAASGAVGAAGVSGAAGSAMMTEAAGVSGAAGSAMMSEAAGVSGAAGSGMIAAAGMSGAAGMQSTMNSGSCCAASDLPGCGTPETQACVCALQPRCCTTAWDETCTFIVAQKFCQPGVRACVCGSAMGQWQQTECCAQHWTDTCDSVAVNKCNARAGCY